jgi:hypothetical protein
MAIVGTAVSVFDRAGGSAGARPLAWDLIAALLPLTVAAGVAVAAHVARQTAPNTCDGTATWAGRVLLAAAVCLGLLPPSAVGLARDALGDLNSVLALNGAAVGLAFLTGAIAYMREPRRVEGVGERREASGGTLVYSQDRADIAVMVGVFALVALASLAAVTYLAIEGLSYGFLPPSNL